MRRFLDRIIRNFGLVTVSIPAPDPSPGKEDNAIRPSQLAALVTEVLDEIDDDLIIYGLKFSQANLEIAAKSEYEIKGGVGGEFRVLIWNAVTAKAGIVAEKEKSITLTYELKKWIATSKLAKRVNKAMKVDVALNPTEFFHSLPEDIKADSGVNDLFTDTDPQAVIQSLNQLHKEHKEALRPFKTENAKRLLVTVIENAIQEYLIVRKRFSDTTFDVEIGFGVGIGFESELEIMILYGSFSAMASQNHLLKMSFEKSDARKKAKSESR